MSSRGCHEEAFHKRSNVKLIGSFLRLQVNELMNRVSASSTPSIHRLQEAVEFHSIPAIKYTSKLARSRPASLSLTSLDYSLHGRLSMVYKCFSTLTLWRCRCAPRCLLNHSLQGVFPSMLNYHHQVHHQTSSISASEGISEFAPSSWSGAPRNAVKHFLQPARYTMFRW
jgi:hypothetical protein